MRLKYIGPGNYFQVSGRELPVHEMYHLVFLLVLLVSSGARKRSRARRRRISFDFNCQSKCGKYNKEDRWGRNLQKGCTAMEKSDKCQQKFVIKKTNKEKKWNWNSMTLKSFGPHKRPMPWMTLISVKGSQCGGTLINNQFVLTAASCFCSAAMLCKRMAMDVQENVPNKIRVSWAQFIKKGNINLK